MKKNRKLKLYFKRFCVICIGLLLIFLIIKLISSFNKPSTTSNETQIEESEIIQPQLPKKIDYLANVKDPVYKKNEKDIKIPIIIYHAFNTPIPEGDVYKLFSTRENFDENVSTLLNAGYTFITLEDLYKYNNEEIALPEKVVILTMDDGWLGCYTEAFPVLQKYQIPTTIFVVNKLVGTEGYFSWEQAKEMYDSGLVKIHCHGYSHIEYNNVSKEQLINDFTKSHAEIEEHLEDTIQKIMAYPSGKYSENSIAWLKEIGFEIQVQTKYGTVNKSRNLDLTMLGRIRGERATGSQLLKAIENASN